MTRKKNEPSPDAAERKALLDYIKELDPSANFVAIGWQLKRMTDEGMTYSGIRYALWYSINVKQMPYRGVGIVPYTSDFPVSNSHAYKMLGNGGPCEVIAHLIRSALTED